MKEIFMILDFNDTYAVSNKGRIKNVKTGRILHSFVNPHGYLQVMLCKDKKKYSYRIHRLVAYCFIPNKENKPYINHIDGNKQNNEVSNLEWCTAKENNNHARKNGLKVQNHPIQATNISTGEVLVFESLSECARILNCNKAYIHRTLKHPTKNIYKNFKLEYKNTI